MSEFKIFLSDATNSSLSSTVSTIPIGDTALCDGTVHTLSAQPHRITTTRCELNEARTFVLGLDVDA